MDKTNFTFVPVPTEGSSQRERELHQAVAKSHAARLSHKWRKQVRYVPGHGRRKHQNLGAEDEQAESSAGALNQPLSSPSLLSILQKGNSDPFNVLAVPITPRVNQIVTFFKHGYLPMIYPAFMGSEDTIRQIEALQQQEYRDGVVALRLECSARALLLINVAFMIRTNPHQELKNEALLLKHQSIKALRQELAKGRDCQQVVLNSVSMLFRAALITGNLEEAALHARTLRSLLERKFDEEGVIDLGFLLRVLYQNKQLSVFRFSMSIFDVGTWVPKVLAAYLEPAQVVLAPHKRTMHPRLDPSISAEPLRTLFLELFVGDYLLDLPAESHVREHFALAQVWIQISGTVVHNHLIDFVLRTEAQHHLNFDPIKEQPKPDPDRNLYWQTHRVLALTFLIMFEFNRTNLESVQTVFTKASVFLARLRSAITLSMHVAKIAKTAKSDCSDPKSPLPNSYCNAHLWALCVGSWTEKKHNPSRDRVSHSDHDHDLWWFTTNMPQHAKQMGLKEWPDVKKILRGFYTVDAYLFGLDELITELLRTEEVLVESSTSSKEAMN